MSMLDIHCHILPRVDDGAKRLAQSERMLSVAQAAGVTEIVATPHLFRAKEDHLYRVQRAFTLMKRKASAYGIELYLGYEVMYNNLDKLDIEDYCYQWPKEKKVFLLEFKPLEYPKKADVFLCDCIDKGMTPIIAHPERYKFVQDDLHMIAFLKGYGCLIQVDARALMKSPLSIERKTAQAMIDAGLVDSISSDAHNTTHYRQYKKVMEKLEYWRPYSFDGLLDSPAMQPETSVGRTIASKPKLGIPFAN